MAERAGTETWVEVEGRRLRIGNLDKVMYPATGTTKAEVLDYYARVAPVLLPHLADRALTRIRWPHGTDGPSFFEKNLPSGAPRWLTSVRLDSPGSRTGDAVVYPVVDGLAALTYLANLASLELHVHQWRLGRNHQPKNPDRLVVDLDPGAPAGLGECCRAALLVRERLASRGLSAVPVTSGSKGLHLYAALSGRRNAERVRDLAREVAEELESEHRELVLSAMTRARRRGKVFVDWSQNTAAKTTIAPYSLRGRERPTVAAPRTWSEIEAGAEDPLAIEQCELGEVLDRVGEHGDLFAPVLDPDTG